MNPMDHHELVSFVNDTINALVLTNEWKDRLQALQQLQVRVDQLFENLTVVLTFFVCLSAQLILGCN
jgi:hypothetical protein